MSGNTERFTGRVLAYARYRREYPAAKLLSWLGKTCDLSPEWFVADAAAGTGMLTEVFLANGNPVVAIEPNAEMREVCEGLRAEWPQLNVVNGTAEATGLESGSMQMITVGRAFHWFDAKAAAEEFQRVLRPGGWVVLVSSGRKKDNSVRGCEFEQVLIKHGTDAEYGTRRRLREAGWGTFLQAMGRPESYRRVTFEEAWEMGLEELRGMVQSVSCAPLPGDARYEGMQQALEAFFTRWSDAGRLRWMEECVVETAQVA